MASLKVRAARAGAKYAVTHPRSRLTRLAVRVVVRRLIKRAIARVGLLAFAWLAFITAGVVLAVRRRKRGATAPYVPSPVSPTSPSAAAPLETHDAATTNPIQARSDDQGLAARVAAELSVGAAALMVEANAGVVTLRGPVADEETESRFVRDAEAVPGVKAVQSELHPGTDEPGPEAS